MSSETRREYSGTAQNPAPPTKSLATGISRKKRPPEKEGRDQTAAQADRRSKKRTLLLEKGTFGTNEFSGISEVVIPPEKHPNCFKN